MTEYRTTVTARRRRTLVCVLAILGIVTVALIAIGGMSGHAIAATLEQSHAIDDQDRIGPDEPPANETYAVEITPRAPDDARVDVTIRYDARSAAELERARNDTLAAEWFRGEEIVREAVATRDRNADATEHASTNYSVPRSDDANTVTIRYRAQWADIPSTDSDHARFGPGFAVALDSGDVFRVSVPVERWEDWNVTRERPETVTHAEHIYSWTIGDDPDPEITLYRGSVAEQRDDSDGDDALGISLAVPLLALLLAGCALARRRRL